MRGNFWVYDIVDENSVEVLGREICEESIAGKAVLEGKEFLFYADTKQRREVVLEPDRESSCICCFRACTSRTGNALLYTFLTAAVRI